MKKFARVNYALSLFAAIVCALSLMVDATEGQFVIHPKNLAAACGSLCTDLVAYWNLDEQSGTRDDAYKAEGPNAPTGYPLTDNNTVGAVNRGPVGTVAKFTAGNVESLSKATPIVDTAGDFTAVFWAKLSNPGPTEDKELFGDTNGNRWGMRVEIQWSGNHRIYTRHGYGVSLEIGAHADKWVMFAYKYVASTTSSYVMAMGSPTNSGVWSSADVSALAAGASFHLCQSGSSDDTTTQMGPGGLWSSALSDATLTSLFNSGNGKAYADLTTAEKVGLVSYWNLDEVSGTRADSHGANTLTDNNTVTSVTSTGGAMDGAAASFVAASSETLSLAGGIPPGSGNTQTISAWMKATGVSSWLGIRHDLFTIIGIYTGGASQYVQGYNYTATDGPKTVEAYTGAPLGEWALVIAEVTQPGTLKLWHNNIYIGQSAATTVYRAPTSLQFAVDVGGSTSTGLIDEVAIWSRVLTSDERTDLYNSGSGIFYDGTEFAYLFFDQPFRYAQNRRQDYFFFRPYKPPLGLWALKKAS